MEKILGIGNALVDVMTIIDNDIVLEKFALPKGSMQIVDKNKSELVKSGTKDLKRSLASGGSAANTIHGLAMLGLETGYIGSIGKDDIGDFFERDLKNAHINTFLLRRDSPTGTAIALVSPDSERTFATHLGAAVEMEAADLNPDDFRNFQILYIEGYQITNKPLVVKACQIAKENNMKIALDLASYNVVEAFLSDFKEIIEKYVDIVFANEEEAKSFTGMAPEDSLNSISKLCEVAVVKVGSEGSWIKRGEEVVRIGTPKVKVKDTTGAGDLYASGFLYGYSKNQNLELCGQYGSILAGNVIEIVGARMSQDRWDKIRKSISKIESSEIAD
ncbi:MAG TPA: adenosine kinase [Bacteroidales bacterium]|nr:adenosine kinase [Bacteroidales bacterium]HPT22673.1 adenosine kinase [Bacteroidales bacterium]